MPSRYEVQIRRDLRKYPLSAARLGRAARGILKSLGWKQAALGIWLVGDRKIRALNKHYLRHDRPTDVISFSQLEGRKLRAQGPAFLGDLVISLDTTARQAKDYGNSFFYELAFYVCHGVLHLMGHSDATPELAARMERRQKSILKKIGVRRDA